MKKALLWLAAMSLSASSTSAITFTTLSHPLAAISPYPSRSGTFVEGISGNNIVGSYVDSAGDTHGFVFNGSTYTTMDNPLGVKGTFPRAISGQNIVGTFLDAAGAMHGFSFNGSSYSTLDASGAAFGTFVAGISGNKVMGSYFDASSVGHGFVYDGSSYVTLPNPPGARNLGAVGISGGNIVGWYQESPLKIFGFLYDGTSFTTLTDPEGISDAGGANQFYTRAFAISGRNIVGEYYNLDSNILHAFVYDGSSYTNFDEPLSGRIPGGGGGGTWATGIDGNTIVGTYTDSANNSYGFIAIIPEPPSLALFVLGVIGLLGVRLLGTRIHGPIRYCEAR